MAGSSCAETQDGQQASSPNQAVLGVTSNFSFRDPDGRLFKVQDRILRVVAAEAALRLESILVSSQGEELVRTGEIIPTRRLEGEEAADSLRHPLLSSFCNGREMAVFEHDPITIATFPFEWAPEMLRAAGELTDRKSVV